MMTTTQMQLTQLLHKEMEQEARTTRKMLERVPEDKYDWRPHPKSMTMLQLATHIAELPAWVSMTLHTDGLDFATSPYQTTPITHNGDLLTLFEQSLTGALADLDRASDEDLLPTWTLRDGDHILSDTSKGEMVRMSFSQIVHHRAQLGVYLRLLDIPIPAATAPAPMIPAFKSAQKPEGCCLRSTLSNVFGLDLCSYRPHVPFVSICTVRTAPGYGFLREKLRSGREKLRRPDPV
jgi:uncharacterized damage-inducible protein DinB